MDEELLARLDKAEEIQQIGRSAVLRRATAEYLAHQSRLEIARQYQEAYGADADLRSEFKGWEDEAAWMDRQDVVRSQGTLLNYWNNFN